MKNITLYLIGFFFNVFMVLLMEYNFPEMDKIQVLFYHLQIFLLSMTGGLALAHYIIYELKKHIDQWRR